MIYHILNGDALAENFKLEGEVIICREAFIEGNIKARDLDELWKVRAEYIKITFGTDDYFEKVKGEFDKLKNLNSNDEVNLWFGNEAFCQINMSFVLWILSNQRSTLYRVFPDSENWDCSFGNINNCFESRQKMTWEEVLLLINFWLAFQAKDPEKLSHLGLIGKNEFPTLINFDQICRELIEIDIKPKEILFEITKNGETDLNKIFPKFKDKAGIYGFGDLQVKSLLDL